MKEQDEKIGKISLEKDRIYFATTHLEF